MLNGEKYEERIKELGYKFALCKGELCHCEGLNCPFCDFHANGRNGCTKNKIKWLLEKYKEPILTSKEKAYLKNVIEPKRNDVTNVVKSLVGKPNKYYTVNVYNKNSYNNGYESTILSFIVTEDMPFENMELYKHYSLEELGL